MKTTAAALRRRRAIQGSLLAVGVLALGAVFTVFFNWTLVAIYVALFPLPLFVFWFAFTATDRQARIDAIAADRAARVKT